MKSALLTLLVAIIIYSLIGCSAGSYTVSEKGDVAKIEMKDENTFNAEIVTILDTVIIFETVDYNYFILPGQYYVNTDQIKSIDVKGYNGSGWLPGVIIFQFVPAILIGVAAASYTHDPGIGTRISALLSIPAFITALIFGTSEGEIPHWDDSLPLSEIQTLEIYARYPSGTSKIQIERLKQNLEQGLIKKYEENNSDQSQN